MLQVLRSPQHQDSSSLWKLNHPSYLLPDRSEISQHHSIMASIFLKPNHPPHYIEATEVYRVAPDTDSEVKLRIASGGAGQSGLIRAFAEGFIKDHMKKTAAAPFAVAWMASDTTMSFNSLALKGVDMSITYHPIAEKTAIQQGIADRREYIWRDHWMLVG